MMRISPAALLAFSAISCFACAAAPAADDHQAFLAAMRERSYFDTATEYLAGVGQSASAPQSMRQAVPLDEATVLMEWAAAAGDAAARQNHLRLAEEKLKDLIQSAGDSELATKARLRLGDLLLYKAAELTKPPTLPQTAEALAIYKQAHAAFADAAKSLRAQLDQTQKDDRDLREELGSQWLAARVNAARAQFEMGQAIAEEDEDRARVLGEAAAECAEIYQSYPRRLAGVMARLYEGRCYQALGDDERAVAAYRELLAALPTTDPQYRSLRTETISSALDCWLRRKEYSTAVNASFVWAQTARPDELADPRWVAVRTRTAEALEALAAQLPEDDPKAAVYLRDARELSAGFAPSSGGLRKQSPTVLAQADPPGDDKGRTPTAELKTFEELYDRANEAIDDMKSSQLEARFMRRESPPDEQRIAQLEQTAKQREQEAFELLKRALPLAGSKTDPEKLQTAIYSLSYFHYQYDNFYEAAVLGEHLARHAPDSPNARPAVRVALAALDALRQKAEQAGEKTDFEQARLLDLAEYITRQWPDQPEAEPAADVLLGFYISEGQYEKALEVSKRLSKQSTMRADIEARLGHALWAQYLRASQELREQQASAAKKEGTSPSTAAPKPTTEMDALLQRAQEMLENAADGLRKQPQVTDRTVLAALSLAQLYLNQSQPAKAAALLEDDKIGPLTLARKDHPAMQHEGVAGEIYKTALRAFVGTDPPQMEKAVAAMESLERAYATDPESAQRLTQMLVAVAYDLQQDLAELERRGDAASQAQVTKAFDAFLSRIAQRPAGTDFRTLYWVASTYEKLADGLQGTAAASEAAAYHQRALQAYEQIIARARQDTSFVPAEQMLALRLQLALAQRRCGQYDKAIATLAELIKQRPRVISLQVEAARTYQMRGAAENPSYFEQAILGAQGAQTSIWGWGKIAIQTARDPRFREVFHEARYNLALCRRQLAEATEDEERKSKLLDAAKNDIKVTKSFDATLGGDQWREKYDRLMRDLQQETGEPVTGLEGI